MFDKFGEMSSYKEINTLAENLFNEGDIKSLKEMAKENGIAEDFVELYLLGDIMELCDAETAAYGKIDVEVAELKLKGIMEDWVEYLRVQISENDLLAHQVRKKGKSLKDCIAALLKWSFKNQIPVDKEILKAAGVTAGKVTLGIPAMGKAKEIIRNYYLGGEKSEKGKVFKNTPKHIYKHEEQKRSNSKKPNPGSWWQKGCRD